jgi:hypothetical protein
LTGPPTDLVIVPRTLVPLPLAFPAGAAMLALAAAKLRRRTP